MHSWIIPILPLAGAAINGLSGKRFSRGLVSAIALASTEHHLPWPCGWPRSSPDCRPTIPDVERYATWLSAGSFSADFGIYLDQLSLVMMLVVTGVGFLIRRLFRRATWSMKAATAENEPHT